MDIFGLTSASAYRPLSFCGPSMSMPSVLPSSEKEWQLAQVGIPVSTTRLRASPIFRTLHWISGMASCASGLMTPFSVADGISGTSR